MAKKNTSHSVNRANGAVKMLALEDVLNLHERLTIDFAEADDPISPPGVKSMQLLQSAVFRQETGSGDSLKYGSPIENASALAYGLCLNHPFHNGNKRTSLVAMLCHLDRNDLTISEGVQHKELYEFMLRVASHGFAEQNGNRDQSDYEVVQMARWLRQKTRRVERGERIVTFRELKRILINRGFDFEDLRDNSIELIRYEDEKTFFGFGKTKRVRKRIMRMSYPGDGVEVGKDLLRELRTRCGLTNEDGVDSAAFYSGMRDPDFFVSKYRGTLRRLAKV